MDEATFLALPEAQRKELQSAWRAQGIYAGPLDGRSGDGVRSALRSLATQRQQNQQYDLERMRLEQQGNEAAANRQREERAAQERQQREAGADPITNIAVPMGIGTGVGMAASYGLNSIVGAGDRARVRAINEIGEEIGPTRDLTASQTNRARAVGAAKAAERFAPATGMGKLGAALKRIGSYGIPGGAVLNEYHRYDTIANDESRPWAERQAAARIANGLLGVGTGIVAEGAARALNPVGAVGEGRSMMRIEAARDLARRMDDADAARASASTTRLQKALAAAETPAAIAPPAATPTPAPRNSQSLQAAARAAGGSGRMSKTEAAAHLATNITDNNRGAVAKALGVANGPNLQSRIMQTIKTMASKPGTSAIIPATIGYSVYDALRSPAEAGEGEETSEAMSRPVAATAGAGAAAATGGGAYGLSRLINAMKPAVRSAIGMTGEAMAPVSIDSMTDYSPDDLATANNWMAQNLPTWAMPGPARQVHDMSQVPERNPMRGVEAPPASQPPAAPAETPPPPEDTGGMSEFDQLVMASEQDPELAAMLRDAILARVQQANEQQIPNAMASQAVASRGSDPMAAALRNFAQR